MYELKDFLFSLRDVRLFGMVMFAIVALMITWSGIQVIETNYKLQRTIAQLQQENAVRELENSNIALENTYFETDEYLELEARKNFGLAAPGETLWVVPKNIALSKTISTQTIPEISEEAVERSRIEKNVSAWLDFLLYRNRPELTD